MDAMMGKRKDVLTESYAAAQWVLFAAAWKAARKEYKKAAMMVALVVETMVNEVVDKTVESLAGRTVDT